MMLVVYLFLVIPALICGDTDVIYTIKQSKSEEWSRVKDLFADYWNWRLEQSPEFATSLGLHQFDDSLERFTFEAFHHRKEKSEELLQRIEEVNALNLSRQDRLELQLLRDDLLVFLDGYRWSRFTMLNPINNLEGIHKDYTFWLDAMKFTTEDDYRKYIKRLTALATQVYEQLGLMREAVRQGWTNHRVSMDAVVASLDGLDTISVIETPFFKPFNESLKVAGFSSNKVDRLQEQGVAVISDQVLPAYRRLKHFINQEYIPNCRREISISSLYEGEKYYADVIKWYTDLDLSPGDLHNLAHQLIDYTKSKIDKIRKKIGEVGSLSSFVRYSMRNPKFTYQSSEDVLKAYERIVYKKIPSRWNLIFANISVLPLRVYHMPFDGPEVVHMPPSRDDTMPAIFFVNTREPSKRHKWKTVANALRETIPGKHLLISALRQMNLPQHRKHIDLRKTYSAPFHFPFHSAFTQGWSLYAETLGRELGMTGDPYNEYGLLYSELYQTARVVVDTGIHAFGWSRGYAVQYLRSTLGVSEHQAEDEVNTCITVPGQATAARLGFMKISQLKLQAKAILGASFNIKEFHERILQYGPISISRLIDNQEKWLEHFSAGGSSQLFSNEKLFCMAILFSLVFNCLVSFHRGIL